MTSFLKYSLKVACIALLFVTFMYSQAMAEALSGHVLVRDQSKKQISIIVSSEDAAQIKVGKTISIKLDDGTTLTGTVTDQLSWFHRVTVRVQLF